MRPFYFAAVFLVAISARLFAADNSLTDREKQDGWKLLFDGRTTKGMDVDQGKAAGRKACPGRQLEPPPL